MGNLTRGAYGSTINAHAAGSQFARIDEALFKYAVPRNWIGRTVWVKLVSYNVFSGGIQDLAEVPAYSYTIKGAPLGQIQNLRLTSSWAYGKEAVIAWDKLDGADTYDVEIYAGNSQRRLREVSGIVDNSYTYTQADMKSDGGQVRDIVFKVRGRAVTGKTGNWAQIAAQNPQLAALQGIAIDSGLKQAFFTCQKPAEEDFAGIIVWVSENAAVPTTDANKVYDGAETFVTVAKCNGKPLEKGKTYHLRAAGYDSFGKDNLRVSNSVSFTVYDVNTTDLSESNLNKALRDKIALIDGNGTGSVNERIKTVQSTADGNKATVQTHAKSINGLEAQYTVKVDANGKVAGFGLATTPKNGTPESKFIVNADRFGIGATGKADVFPFVVDTQKNRVGVNGELVVNGKAIVDKLNAGDIHGDKITANTLDANRLKAGSVTAREIGANSVTADKMNVTSLSAVSSNLGSITGGSLSIGNGKFSVTENGVLTANDAVIRGRIEADSGYFNGTIKASHVEGDVMKVHRMRRVSENVWELILPPDDLIRMFKPDFIVSTDSFNVSGSYEKRSGLKVKAAIKLNDSVLPIYPTYLDNHYYNSYSKYDDNEPKYEFYTTYFVKYGWYLIRAGVEARITLEIANHEQVNSPSPCVFLSYLSTSDHEYKSLSGNIIWKTFKDSAVINNPKHLSGTELNHEVRNISNMVVTWGKVLRLPENIYGLSFEYKVETNSDWASGVYWDSKDWIHAAKPYSNRNHNGDFKTFTKELDGVVFSSNILLLVSQDWQWVELRNIRVLVPEFRKNEVW